MLHTFEVCKLFFFIIEESVLLLWQKSGDTKDENTHPIGQWNDHENEDFMETQKINDTVKMVPSGHTTTNNGGMFSSASTSSFSPLRYSGFRT